MQLYEATITAEHDKNLYVMLIDADADDDDHLSSSRSMSDESSAVDSIHAYNAVQILRLYYFEVRRRHHNMQRIA